ncbi:MAG: HORMA domain containing protein [Alcaligenes nematophilus]|uniref:HORMA domain containing protein n=1 Tax=Alcaligenes nematophilus TaxID=2994643 RepID=UPI003D02E0A9
MSSVATYNYTHSVTYVTDNILKSLKDIIVKSGMDPANFVNNWVTNSLAIKTWLTSEHLQKVILEVYDPATNKLIFKWEISVVYNGAGSGDGSFWTDTEQLAYAIRKAGVVPSQAKYDVLTLTKKGRPDVQGWGSVDFRSTEGMIKQSLGTTIEHNGLGAETAYWRQG